MKKETAFSLLVVAIAIFLLTGIPGFLKMAQGNLSVQDNLKEISLSPVATFLLGIGFVGVWLLVHVPGSNAVLAKRRFIAAIVLVGVCVFGLQALLNFAWS